MDIQNIPIFWLSGDSWPRAPHGCVFLHGRTRVVLVPVDGSEWIFSFLVGNVAGTRIAIRSVILWRSIGSFVQAPADQHSGRIPNRIWEAREQDYRPSSFMFVELLCVRTDIGAPPRSLGPPPVILTPGDWARTVIGRQNVGSPPW